MKFSGRVQGGTMNKLLNFGGNQGILRWVNEQKTPRSRSFVVKLSASAKEVCSLWLLRLLRLSFIVFLLSVLSLILLLFSYLSANSFDGYLLKNCYTYSLQTSHTGRPLSDLVQGLFFESIRIAIRDLECIMDFQFFLHISTSYHSIFNFNTSLRRSLLVLYFIFFDLRALANLWGRYGSKTVFLIVFGM